MRLNQNGITCPDWGCELTDGDLLCVCPCNRCDCDNVAGLIRLANAGQYQTVVIDPPWLLAPFGPEKRADFAPDYEMMPFDHIEALPIADVLDKDAMVFLWTVNRYLPRAYDLLSAWGLTYTFTMAWVKPGGVKSPTSPMFNTEWVVVGKKGHPTFVDTKAFKTGNAWPRRGHSVKPEEFYELLRRVTPEPRLDIFARRRIAGFDAWGNELDDKRYGQDLLI